MARYVKRPRAGRGYCEDDLYDDDRRPLLPGLDVADHEASFTGLLDADGDEIWRSPNPMGFGRDGEWQ